MSRNALDQRRYPRLAREPAARSAAVAHDHATIVNVSRGGACLCLDEAPPVDKGFALQFRCDGQDHVLRSCVVWSRRRMAAADHEDPILKGGWLAGIAFAESESGAPVSDGALNVLRSGQVTVSSPGEDHGTGLLQRETRRGRPDARGPGAGKRPHWYQLYFLLAALDVATVLVSLVLNHFLLHYFHDSVAISREWASREDQHYRLAQLAAAVNAPGNDVFDSRDAAAERARMRGAKKAFEVELAASRDEIARNVRVPEATQLLAAFDKIDYAMREMVADAEQIFALFEAKRAGRAGERMATMDRKYARVNQELNELSNIVQSFEQAHFGKQLAAAELLGRLEYVVVGLMVLMVAGALYYGSRIYRAMQAAEAEHARYIDDISRAHAEADAANLAKSRFLAFASHEIRTPLNTIFLTLDMLDDVRPGEDRQSYLAVARSSARTLKRLVDDVLTLSRIESGKIELELVPFDIREFLIGLLAPHVHVAATKSLPLSITVETEVPQSVYGDPTRLGEIVANLVDNAIKFTDTGSIAVSILLRREKQRNPQAGGKSSAPLRIEVRDTGIGIPTGQETRIFEDFIQAEVAPNRTRGGAGLGLAIVRNLVRIMGGNLGVGPTPGGGSTFWVDLDLPVSDEASSASPGQQGWGGWENAFAGRRVLLVEDSVESRTVTTAVLNRMGVTVEFAANGQDAVAKSAATVYDAILMDVAMPVMDGFEATRRIRDSERGGVETPIIALTAQVMDNIFEKCLDAGMDDYLAKPATRDNVGAVLRRWIEPARAPGSRPRQSDPLSSLEDADRRSSAWPRARQMPLT